MFSMVCSLVENNSFVLLLGYMSTYSIDGMEYNMFRKHVLLIPSEFAIHLKSNALPSPILMFCFRCFRLRDLFRGGGQGKDFGMGL